MPACENFRLTRPDFSPSGSLFWSHFQRHKVTKDAKKWYEAGNRMIYAARSFNGRKKQRVVRYWGCPFKQRIPAP